MTEEEKIEEKPVLVKTIVDKQERILTEREIRRYVKRTGGYRKDLLEKHKELCGILLRKMGRKEVIWDFNIIVPGIDKPSVARIDVEHS